MPYAYGVADPEYRVMLLAGTTPAKLISNRAATSIVLVAACSALLHAISKRETFNRHFSVFT